LEQEEKEKQIMEENSNLDSNMKLVNDHYNRMFDEIQITERYKELALIKQWKLLNKKINS